MLRLKQLRGSRTQTFVANEIGITQRAYQNYESGTRQADYDTLVKMAKYFNVSVDYILGVTDSMWTAEDYANGVRDTKRVVVTADEEDALTLYQALGDKFGVKGKLIFKSICENLLTIDKIDKSN